MPPAPRYDGFISYSHRTGGALGPALRDAIHDFGRSWYQMRALRVFCDRSSIAPSESLWATLEDALLASRTFILLASPESARSPWVGREVAAWTAIAPRRPMIIVLTEGDIAWSERDHDFDWSVTDALPRQLHGWFADEPLWLDLREVAARAHRDGPAVLSTGDPRFLDAVATLASALQGRPKDELIGADVQKYRSARRFRRTSWVGLSVLTVAALVAALVAVVQRGEAQQRAVLAVQQKLLAEADALRTTDPVGALRRGLAAQAIVPGAESSAAVLDVLASTRYRGRAPVVDPPTPAVDVAFAPVGNLLVIRTEHTGDPGNIVQLWDAGDPVAPRALGPPLPGQRGNILSARFGPGGRTLITTGGDGTLVAWDVADPTRPRPLGPPTDVPGLYLNTALAHDVARMVVRHVLKDEAELWDLTDPTRPRPLAAPFPVPRAAGIVALSPDGRTLAMGSNSGEITLFDVADPARPRARGTGNTTGLVAALTFSPDGRTLATGSYAGPAQLWKVTGAGPPIPLGAPIEQAGGVLDVAYAPDGATLATAGEDHTTKLWNIADPARPLALPPVLAGHDGRVGSVAFSADGRTVATGSLTDGVRLWSTAPAYQTRPRGAPIPGRGEEVRSIDAAAGRPSLLVGADSGGTVTAWDVSDPATPRAAFQAAMDARSVALADDGKTLALASREAALLVDITDPSSPTPRGPVMPQGDEFVNDVALRPDGRVLVMSSVGLYRSSLWDTADPAAPRPIGGRLAIDTLGGEAIAFRGDGRLLVADGQDNSVVLLNVVDPAAPRKLGVLTGHSRSVVALALTPDGRTVATGSWDNSLILWDVSDPAAPRRLGLPIDKLTGGVTDVAFSPDGGLLAAAVGDEGVLLWDVSDPARPRRLAEPLAVAGHATATALAFLGPGTLAAGGKDGTVVLWDLDGINRLRDTTLATACALAGRGFDPAEWALEVPGLDYRPTCPG